MANTRTTKSTGAAGTAAKAPPKEEAVPAAESAAPERVKIVPKEIDPDQYVTVRNGFQGKLVYRSKKTGEKYVWDAFGDEQDMELSELKRAKSSAKRHFIDNWFMFDEPWIADYLGVGQYYRNAVKIEDFDKVFTLPAEKAAEAVSKMSDGQKKSAAYRARQLIADGTIDSNRTIAALEKCLGVELVERF